VIALIAITLGAATTFVLGKSDPAWIRPPS
jgi:hypothetical protein